jgi:hypothetical protein
MTQHRLVYYIHIHILYYYYYYYYYYNKYTHTIYHHPYQGAFTFWRIKYVSTEQ